MKARDVLLVVGAAELALALAVAPVQALAELPEGDVVAVSNSVIEPEMQDRDVPVVDIESGANEGGLDVRVEDTLPEGDDAPTTDDEAGIEAQSGTLPLEDIRSGTAGTCDWSIGTDGTLVVSPQLGSEGTLNNSPWTNSKYRDEIKSARFEGTIHVESAGHLFSNCSNLGSISWPGVDFSGCYHVSSMFIGCSSLRKVDLTPLGVRTWKDMSWMFSGCSSLTAIDVSSLDTSGASDPQGLSHMFQGCSSLTSLDLSGFDVSQVRYLNAMFYGCSSLRSLSLSGWDTSNALWMHNMFEGCASLKSLDLSGWDTASVTNMDNMFDGCNSLERLVLGSGFSFRGSGASRLCSAPYGTWVAQSSGARYDEGNIPNNVADTYVRLPNLSDATVLVSGATYTGKALKPAVKVMLGGKALTAGTDYTVSYANNVNAGTASVTVAGKGNYSGSHRTTFSIAKAANTLSAKGKKVTLKTSKLKTKAQTVRVGKALVVKGAQGKVTYTLSGVTKKKFKKFFKVAKSGKITVKKGLGKGTYKLKVKVIAAGDANHNSLTKSVTCKVVVK